jgi:hypothetical protein
VVVCCACRGVSCVSSSPNTTNDAGSATTKANSKMRRRHRGYSERHCLPIRWGAARQRSRPCKADRAKVGLGCWWWWWPWATFDLISFCVSARGEETNHDLGASNVCRLADTSCSLQACKGGVEAFSLAGSRKACKAELHANFVFARHDQTAANQQETNLATDHSPAAATSGCSTNHVQC